MLYDKMTFRRSGGGGSGLSGEDSQSRDSGNSSGGSPDFGGLRRERQRRSAPPPSGTEWYQQHSVPILQHTAQNNHPQNYHHHHPHPALQQHNSLPQFRRGYQHHQHLGDDDAVSSFSYETARDMLDPADVVLASARASYRERLASSTSTTTDNGDANSVFSEASSSINNWHYYHGGNDLMPRQRRRLDCLKEDVSYHAYGDHMLKQQQQQQEQRDNHRQSDPENKSSRVLICLSRLWLVARAVLTAMSLCLLIAGALFLWRAHRCESDRQRAFSVELLRDALDQQLFGQHLARAEILREMAAFSRAGSDGESSVHVLILVGWPGGGKTHTANILRSVFPTPENVHSFSVPLHFAGGGDSGAFLDDLSAHVVRSCGHSLVLFDDVDGASKEVAQFVGALSGVRGVGGRRSNGTLVVITSNAGGAAINDLVLERLKSGARRPDITRQEVMEALQDVEIPCLDELRPLNVRVKVVPFLPLGRDQVRQCVGREIRGQGLDATEEDVEAVAGQMGYFSQDFPVLAKSGCKQVAAKVDVYLGGRDPYLLG